MRLIIIFLLCLVTSSLMSQTSVVYKRNPATGQLEVFESRGGLPIGQPLYKIKKNVYGYLEIENSDASQDPFSKKPDYSHHQFKSYQLPAKQIFETLENLNRRNEYDYINRNNQPNSNQGNDKYKEVEEFIQNRSLLAKSYLDFYNSNVLFPSQITSGWHEVVRIYKLGSSDKYIYKSGICKTINNKIEEYYENCHFNDLKTGFVFQKIKMDVVSNIVNCKSTYREAGSESYYTLYFLDNILDSSKVSFNPNFGYYTIYTDPNFNMPVNSAVMFDIARNKTITREDVQNFAGGPYSTALTQPNPQTIPCSNSLLTLAFRQTTDNFSIGIYNLSNKKIWLLNNLSIISGSCQASLLTNN